MENLSIKILDVLFDLCEGEDYAILDKEDIVADFPDHVFETDELTDILEALAVEGFIDLKYADNTEFCVAMRTKGRTLIKQSREKLQRILHESSVTNAEPEDVIEMTDADASVDVAPAETVAPQPKRTAERRRPRVSVPPPIEELSEPLVDAHFSDYGKKHTSDMDEYEKEKQEDERQKRRERRTLLAALIGSVAGSLIINLILLIVILVKFK